MRTLAFWMLLTVCAASASAEETRHVLILGIDGCRPDAIAKSKTPNLDKLIQNGTWFEGTDIVSPDRNNPANTISGPGWSNLLCGVWPDKHNVLDNKFTEPNYDEYPHIFARLKEVRPDARTASFSDWGPIAEKILRASDVTFSYQPVEKKPGHQAYREGDVAMTAACIQTLQTDNPTLVSLYLGQVDETGHAFGFHPSVTPYREAIERVDGHIGEVMDAIAARPNAKNENWLVIVCTDHGGSGTDHGNGHKNYDIRWTFMIVSGQNAKKGISDDPTYQVDVAATAMTHLGVEIKPEWKFDGKPVGLEKK